MQNAMEQRWAHGLRRLSECEACQRNTLRCGHVCAAKALTRSTQGRSTRASARLATLTGTESSLHEPRGCPCDADLPEKTQGCVKLPGMCRDPTLDITARAARLLTDFALYTASRCSNVRVALESDMKTPLTRRIRGQRTLALGHGAKHSGSLLRECGGHRSSRTTPRCRYVAGHIDNSTTLVECVQHGATTFRCVYSRRSVAQETSSRVWRDSHVKRVPW